jgi:tetratricopeptide (TPR) repeat protein
MFRPPVTACHNDENLYFWVDRKNGDASVIDKQKVITNCHVVKRTNVLEVHHSGKVYKATLEHIDRERDLCQLNVPGLTAPSATFGSAKKLKVGQRVYAIGAPQGLELTLSEGLISALRNYEGSQFIQTSAPISPGSSGGGLFDADGRLIGITTFYIKGGQNLNFALPVDWIVEVPHRARLQAKAKQENLSRELAWLRRAFMLEYQNDWNGLLDIAKQWIKSNANSEIAWDYLGVAYKNLKQHDKAIQAYKKSIQIFPTASTWMHLGQIYHFRGYFSSNKGMSLNKTEMYKAIHAFKEALRIDPEHAEASALLGRTYGSLGEHTKGIVAIKEAIRLEPDQPAYWRFLGFAYRDIGEMDKGIQAHEKAVELWPESEVDWISLGMAYEEAGRRDGVNKVYGKLRAINPTVAERFIETVHLPR